MFDKEYVFYGKHAQMVKKLAGKLSPDTGKIFDTNYDVYALAPIVGYLYGRKSAINKDIEDDTKVFRDKIMSEKENLMFDFRLLMLAYKSDTLTEQDKIELAFRSENNDEVRKPYDELFNSYVLGGVEVLYEKIFGDADAVEGYIFNLYNFITEFNEKYYSSLSDMDYDDILNS